MDKSLLNLALRLQSFNVILILQGYYGCAAGKAKQNAKTEIEKLKLENMTCKEAIKEVAKM